MRFFIILLILITVDLYVFQAHRSIWKNAPQLWQRISHIIYWAIPVFMILAALFWQRFDVGKVATTYIRTFFFILYISKFLAAIVLFVGDFGIYMSKAIQYLYDKTPMEHIRNYSRPMFLRNMALIIGAIPFTTLIYGVIRNAYRYKVLRTSVALDNLPEGLEGLKIIQISDIHSGSFTFKEPVKRAIELINKEAADLVFFTGDLVNDRASEMDNFMDVFDKIQAKIGTFSVLGNHDYGDYSSWKNHAEKEQNFERIQQVHKELGWNLLMNENRILDINGAKLGIIGVENWAANGRFRTNGDLAKAYKGAENTDVKLLLSHDPSHWDAEITKDFKDIDITFSGHTHGFQFGVNIPGVIKWSPSRFLYKQWSGLYPKGKQYIYVNRGLGFLGYPGRVGMLPEITVMELRKA
jgi:predicted MPP superfamily phosphohydrolase